MDETLPGVDWSITTKSAGAQRSAGLTNFMINGELNVLYNAGDQRERGMNQLSIEDYVKTAR